MEHESILTYASSSSSYTDPSSVSIVSAHNPSTTLKEEAAIPVMPPPTESTAPNFSHPLNIPSYATLDRSLRMAESPMSKACLSSMLPGCHAKYDYMRDGFSEHMMRPDPQEHRSPNQKDTITDKSFVGIVSAINAMNGSMNASRLCNINLASALETYAAVIHSRTPSSSIEADQNEARANCFNHAAVFWMEWATVQANLQLSLMQDLFKLKSFADTSMEHECDSKAEIFNADSIRAMVIKLTKLSHNGFREAYEKGADWSSVGGLNYWIAQLPEPVVQDAPTITLASNYSSTPPRSVADTTDLIAAIETTKTEQTSLMTRRNDEGLSLSNRFSNTDLSHQSEGGPSGHSSLNYFPDSPILRGVSNVTDIEIDEVFRGSNERTVHSFRYPNRHKGRRSTECGDMDFVSVIPRYNPRGGAENRKQYLTRSHQTLDFSGTVEDQIRTCYEIQGLRESASDDLSAKHDKASNKDTHREGISGYNMNEEGLMERESLTSNGHSPTTSGSSGSKLHDFPHNPPAHPSPGVDGAGSTKNILEAIGNTSDQGAASLYNNSIQNLPIDNDDSNEYITGSYEGTAYQDSDSSVSHSGELTSKNLIQGFGQGDLGYIEDTTQTNANNLDQLVTSWELPSQTPCNFYLSRPLPYAITEEDSNNKTPPQKKGLCQIGVAFGYTTPPRGGECSVEVVRPGNIRRKGKFEKKNGAIQMLPLHNDENSSEEDDGIKGGLSTMGRGNDGPDGAKHCLENAINTTTTSGLQNGDISCFDGGKPPSMSNSTSGYIFSSDTNTNVRSFSGKPLEPNPKSPNKYPSHGYFSEDFQVEPTGSDLVKVKGLAQDKQRLHFRWSNHLKKMVRYVPRGDEPTSTPMKLKPMESMSFAAKAPIGSNSRIAAMRAMGLGCL